MKMGKDKCSTGSISFEPITNPNDVSCPNLEFKQLSSSSTNTVGKVSDSCCSSSSSSSCRSSSRSSSRSPCKSSSRSSSCSPCRSSSSSRSPCRSSSSSRSSSRSCRDRKTTRRGKHHKKDRKHRDHRDRDHRDRDHRDRDHHDHRGYRSDRNRAYDGQTSCFSGVVSPLSKLQTDQGGAHGLVEFKQRRRNKVVTLQWEGFSGVLAASGIGCLDLEQRIPNLPPHPVTFPLYIEYKGEGRVTHVMIDPYSSRHNLRFYLRTDGKTHKIHKRDGIKIYGGCIQWIADC